MFWTWMFFVVILIKYSNHLDLTVRIFVEFFFVFVFCLPFPVCFLVEVWGLGGILWRWYACGPECLVGGSGDVLSGNTTFKMIGVKISLVPTWELYKITVPSWRCIQKSFSSPRSPAYLSTPEVWMTTDWIWSFERKVAQSDAGPEPATDDGNSKWFRRHLRVFYFYFLSLAKG